MINLYIIRVVKTKGVENFSQRLSCSNNNILETDETSWMKNNKSKNKNKNYFKMKMRQYYMLEMKLTI